jgi:hypothetical protein
MILMILWQNLSPSKCKITSENGHDDFCGRISCQVSVNYIRERSSWLCGKVAPQVSANYIRERSLKIKWQNLSPSANYIKEWSLGGPAAKRKGCNSAAEVLPSSHFPNPESEEFMAGSESQVAMT